MPIKIPTGIPSGKVLENEQIFVMSSERAYHQDIRPLQILLVNLMPNKQETESSPRQFPPAGRGASDLHGFPYPQTYLGAVSGPFLQDLPGY